MLMCAVGVALKMKLELILFCPNFAFPLFKKIHWNDFSVFFVFFSTNKSSRHATNIFFKRIFRFEFARHIGKSSSKLARRINLTIHLQSSVAASAASR
jgi:hypothetical protein